MVSYEDSDGQIDQCRRTITSLRKEIKKAERKIHKKGKDVKANPPSYMDRRGSKGWSSKDISNGEFADLRRNIKRYKEGIREAEEKIIDINKHRHDGRNRVIYWIVGTILLVWFVLFVM